MPEVARTRLPLLKYRGHTRLRIGRTGLHLATCTLCLADRRLELLGRLTLALRRGGRPRLGPKPASRWGGRLGRGFNGHGNMSFGGNQFHAAPGEWGARPVDHYPVPETSEQDGITMEDVRMWSPVRQGPMRLPLLAGVGW